MAELLPHDAASRTKIGQVVSNKMEKTVVVAVESVRQHRLYGRNVRRTTQVQGARRGAIAARSATSS